MCILNPGLIAAIPLLFLIYTISFVFKLVLWRCHILRLRAEGLPMPPYSVVFGHLLVVNKIISSLPADSHGHYLPDQIRRAYPELGPNFYLDLAPFAPSMLVLTSLDTLHQVTQQHPLEKFPSLRTFLKPLTGGFDIVTMKGQIWKKWRKIFNPGFSAANLATLVPLIVAKTNIFISIIERHSEKQDVIKMKNLLDNLTMDIIGLVVLEEDFDCQRSYNPLVSGIRTQIRWLSFGAEPNLLVRYHPFRPLVHWYYGPKVDAHVSRELQQHLETRNHADSSSTKSVIGLALREYELESFKDGQSATKQSQNAEDIDPLFRKICMAQIKVFLFSGHDTTSSSICYTLYLLSKHPKHLKRVQQELDEVFSTDRRQISERIIQKPALLNEIPYTTAVIKESLRLFPTVSSTRDGERDFFVTDAQGRKFPTQDFLVWVNPHAVQHSPALWNDPDEFQPERWLGDKRNDLKNGAWRAFEHGPRDCIGQNLAMMESKIVICKVARDFVIRDVYAELSTGSNRQVEGERAYQVQLSQPAGDLPCRIEKLH